MRPEQTIGGFLKTIKENATASGNMTVKDDTDIKVEAIVIHEEHAVIESMVITSLENLSNIE